MLSYKTISHHRGIGTICFNLKERLIIVALISGTKLVGI